MTACIKWFREIRNFVSKSFSELRLKVAKIILGFVTNLKALQIADFFGKEVTYKNQHQTTIGIAYIRPPKSEAFKSRHDSQTTLVKAFHGSIAPEKAMSLIKWKKRGFSLSKSQNLIWPFRCLRDYLIPFLGGWVRKIRYRAWMNYGSGVV